MAIFKGW